MELDEMKTLWEEMSIKLDKQIELSERMILDVTQARLEKKVNIFWNSQILVFLVAYVITGTLIFSLHKLDTWLELASAIFWITYLAIMPFYSSGAITPLKNIDIGKMTYKENLSLFFKSRRRVLRSQQISLVLNPFLFIGATILIVRLFLETDILIVVSNSVSVLILAVTLFVTMVALYLAYKKSNAYLSSLQQFISESRDM
jgi:hypothetical protein